jgi:hypothetical protein
MEVSDKLHAPAALPPGKERSPGTHWVGGWAGPRAGLDTVWERIILSPLRESNPNHPIVQPGASRYTDYYYYYYYYCKVNLSLCLTKHHAMKTYWGVEV